MWTTVFVGMILGGGGVWLGWRDSLGSGEVGWESAG